MAYDFHIPFGWWLVIPTLAFVMLVLFAITWRWRKLTIVTVISLLVAMSTAILLPISWETLHDMYIGWTPKLQNGSTRYWWINVVSKHGGVCFEISSVDDPTPPTSPPGLEFRRALNGTNHGSYPIWGDKYSVTKSDFLQKTIGFQVCWWRGLDNQDRPRCKYSITMPHWLVLLLCFPLPFWCLRRYLHERRLRMRGFPVTNSTGHSLIASQVIASSVSPGEPR